MTPHAVIRETITQPGHVAIGRVALTSWDHIVALAWLGAVRRER